MNGRKRGRWKASLSGKKNPKQTKNTPKKSNKRKKKEKKEELVEGEENVLLRELSLQAPYSISLILTEIEKGKVLQNNLERAKNFKWEC